MANAQPIELSDDEDPTPPPVPGPVPAPAPAPAPAPRVPNAQQVPPTRESVGGILQSRGVRLRVQWLDSCMNELAALHSDFPGLSVSRQAELCFAQALMADFNAAAAASLPPSVHALHATELQGPFVLQVDEVTDVGRPFRDRYQEKAAGSGRMLKLSMTDGVQRVSAMEYRPIRALQVFSPAGMKISLKNVCVRRGLLLLVPEVLEVLGGYVEHLESARMRAVQLINKPPRGRTTRRNEREVSLAERATAAAWPPDPSLGSNETPSENGQLREQHSHPASTSNNAQENRPSYGVRNHSVHHSPRRGEQAGAEHTQRRQDQPDVSGSHVSATAAPMQVEGFTNARRPYNDERGPYPSVGDQSSVGLEQDYHQPRQPQNVQQGPLGAENRRQSPRYGTLEELTTSTQVSGGRNGLPVSSPTLGRLSLQSRRLVQSNASSANTTEEPRANERSLGRAGTTGAAPSINFAEGEELEQHASAVNSSPVSRTEETAAFTYLSVLNDKANSQMSDETVVQGKVKCVITEVISFLFKDLDEFKLLVHIEDGSLVAKAVVQHQVVQRLIGCSPREMTSRMRDPSTHQEMKDTGVGFQKLLQKFEGFMDVELSNSSSVFAVLQMTSGMRQEDTRLFSRQFRNVRHKHRTYDTTGFDFNFDLATP